MSDMDLLRYNRMLPRPHAVVGYIDGSPVLAKDLLAELKRIRAENAALRTQALNWVTVTDDPATLPEEYRVVRMRRNGHIEMPMYRYQDTDGARWAVLAGDFTQIVRPGDRWAYLPPIPEMK